MSAPASPAEVLKKIMEELKRRFNISSDKLDRDEIMFTLNMLREEYRQGRFKVRELEEQGISEDFLLFAVLEGLGFKEPDKIIHAALYVKGIVQNPPPLE